MPDAASPRQQHLGDLLRRSAGRVPTKPALIFGELRYSFSRLDEFVNRFANALTALGVLPGQHVALLSHNSDVFVIARFALARLGAVAVPINFMLNADEVAYIVDHANIVGLIVEDALCAVGDAALARCGRSLAVRLAVAADDDVPQGWTSARSLLAWDDDREPPLTAADDAPVQILYTSGTESRPKGVVLTARNLYANYTNCIVGGEMTESDVEVHALPLYHCAQLDCFLTPDLMLGATSILLAGADAGAILAAVEREGATKLFCPPTVWLALLQHPDFGHRNLSTLIKGYYGASIMPVEVVLELSRRLPGIRLYNLYGQTEVAPLATLLGPGDQMTRLGAAGKPVIHVETRVVDDDDRPVPHGETGEIVHRGANVMLGYWNDEAATREAFRGGWFHSGDLGVFDADGFLSVVDRKKDMIKSGGENVASREVEEVVFQHPGVAQAAVFAIPHPRWIEAVAVAIVARQGFAVDDADLSRFLRERLAGYKVPKYIFLTDDLPKNATGKVLKRELRLRYAGTAA